MKRWETGESQSMFFFILLNILCSINSHHTNVENFVLQACMIRGRKVVINIKDASATSASPSARASSSLLSRLLLLI